MTAHAQGGAAKAGEVAEQSGESTEHRQQHVRLRNKGAVRGMIGRDGVSAQLLHLRAAGRVRAQPLITHQFPVERVSEAADLLIEHPEEALGVALTYSAT